jgi:fatty-acyl-CoA synthase
MSYYEYPLIIKKLLVQTLYRQPTTEIVYRDISRYSWMKFYERIQRLANALESIGVKRGSKVAVIDFDTHRYLEAYFAVPMMGAILHTVNIRLPPEQILYTVVHAEDDVVLLRDEFLPIVESVASALPTVKAWVIMSDTGAMPSTSLKPVYYYEDLLNSVSSHYDFPDFDENTEATLFYTSGTTGLPKGVHFTHRQLVLHTLSVAAMLSTYPSTVNITSLDVMMPLVPFFHVHSWGLPYVAAMIGNKIVLAGRYDPKIELELIKKEKVTFSHMVPTILHMIVNHPEVENYKEYLKNWKVVIGGAALPRALALKAMQLGIKVLAGYGLSETAPVLTIANPREDMLDWPTEKLIDVITKTGIPIPLVELRVIDSEGKDVPRDGKTVGEIVVRAPWLTKDYYKDPEKTRELWSGGWLHTGDVAVIDEYGYIKIVDRIKDVVKSGGEWISSLTLEDLIALHPAVSEVAVIGAPHPRWGERPVAIIVTRKGMQVTEDELKKYLEGYAESGKIAKWWIPDRFIFVSEIPKTSTGKIDKKVLRDQYKSLF